MTTNETSAAGDAAALAPTTFRIEETALHHSVYEVEAATAAEAEAKLRENYSEYLTEEFWGEVTRDVSEKPPLRP